MSNSRKMFRMAAVFFLLVLLIIAIDFSRRTTFPGTKDRAHTDTLQIDSLKAGSLKNMKK